MTLESDLVHMVELVRSVADDPELAHLPSKKTAKHHKAYEDYKARLAARREAQAQAARQAEIDRRVQEILAWAAPRFYKAPGKA